MNKDFGSTWGKWDFHVHTPYSILNNQFGFDPFDPKNNYHEAEFDEYVVNLFNKAIENKIVAIGITDYFMIEGYKRLKEKYLCCSEKMEALFPDPIIREKIKKIFVFPNIEMRINTFVGKDASPVNYHIIFSDKIPITDIEENFIKSLKFEINPKDRRSITQHNIESLGNEIIKLNGEIGSPLLVGLKHITVNYTDIEETLSNSIFNNKYLIVVPVDEDLSKVSWTGRDYTTRKNIYKQCNCYLTSNANTYKWALASGEENERIAEFGSIKPCIWGSDAHEYEKMFKPDGDRFCWIKALPSFEGLFQILCEPADRVHIQKDKPDIKDSHKIIKSIRFNDERFPIEPVVFSDSLTCIIGGKSTGKSLLLKSLALTIDSDYVREQEQSITPSYIDKPIEINPLNIKNTIVEWQDGTTDKRKIVYIPQAFLNRTIDNPQKDTAISKIIEDVLLQEASIKNARKNLDEQYTKIKGKTFINIVTYEELLHNQTDIHNQILEFGQSKTFLASIAEFEKQRTELAQKINITEDEIKRYSELTQNRNVLAENKTKLENELRQISSMPSPTAIFPNYLDIKLNSNNIQKISLDFPTVHEKINGFIMIMNDILADEWTKTKSDIQICLQEQINSIEERLSIITPEYNALKSKIEQGEQLKKLAEQIEKETEKLQQAQALETKEAELNTKIEDVRNNIINSQKEYYKAIKEYCSIVNANAVISSTDLLIEATIEWKKDEFINFISEAFNNRHFNAFRDNNGMDLTDIAEKDYSGCLLLFIWEAMLHPSLPAGLPLKSTFDKKTVLQRLFGLWYNIHYVVKNGNDTIEAMSPGKKALTLLELLINLSENNCPILIDQPEDDLDNRSIYNELVKFIKNKKHDRQIIVVTHNANVVLGADSELVIVANQDGKDTPNNSNVRFEYRNGAIEDDEIDLLEDGTHREGILNQKGIQTQICDILEGGKNAFELRRNKYNSN